jgi:hypothetical protein
MRRTRYQLTTDQGRVFIVYAGSEAEARAQLSTTLNVSACSVKETGYSENGIIHIPAEELAAIMRSTEDDRIAPGK